MGIKITADRMIDLTEEELQNLGIDTISCYINMGGNSYSDLDDVFPEDVFAYMDKTGHVAQTAAKSPALYGDFFSQFLTNGDSVIHFAVSSGISTIMENAATAAKDYPGQVYVVDTLLLSNGIALLVKYAMFLIQDGVTDPEKIVELVQLKIPKVQCSFLLDSLDCLYKGGRCSGMTYNAANLLKIKPAIHMNKTGHMVVREKHRGAQATALRRYIKETFEKYPDPDLEQLYFTYTTNNLEIQELILEIVAEYHSFKNIEFNYCSCNCCVHSGRNAIAMFYMCL